NRIHPRTRKCPIFSFGMYQQATVSGFVSSGSMGFSPPLKFYSNFIVLIFFVGGNTSPFLAGNADHPILNSKNVQWINVPSPILYKDIPAIEVLAVKQS